MNNFSLLEILFVNTVFIEANLDASPKSYRLEIIIMLWNSRYDCPNEFLSFSFMVYENFSIYCGILVFKSLLNSHSVQTQILCC